MPLNNNGAIFPPGIVSTPLLGPVEYRERPGSPTETFTGDTLRIRRVFDVAWEDRWAFMIALLGYCRVSGSQILRVIPDAYLPAVNYAGIGNENSWAHAISIEQVEPIGKQCVDSDYVASYEVARITVNYESRTYKIKTDAEMVSLFGLPDESLPASQVFGSDITKGRHVSRFLQPTAEVLTLPFGVTKWVDDPPPAPPRLPEKAVSGLTKLIGALEVTYVWHEVPFFKNFTSFLGTVNNAYFDNYPPQTLLLIAAEKKPKRMIDGNLVFDYTYKCKFMSQSPAYPTSYNGGKGGHNHFLRWNVSTESYKYTLMTTDGYTTGQTIYPLSNFSDLFRTI